MVLFQTGNSETKRRKKTDSKRAKKRSHNGSVAADGHKRTQSGAGRGRRQLQFFGGNTATSRAHLRVRFTAGRRRQFQTRPGRASSGATADGRHVGPIETGRRNEHKKQSNGFGDVDGGQISGKSNGEFSSRTGNGKTGNETVKQFELLFLQTPFLSQNYLIYFSNLSLKVLFLLKNRKQKRLENLKFFPLIFHKN